MNFFKDSEGVEKTNLLTFFDEEKNFFGSYSP